MARALLRFNSPKRRSGSRTIISSRSARSCASSASTGRSASSCIRRGPTRGIIAGVPHHRELIEAMLAYDLIGFQTEDDRDNFEDYLAAELDLRSRRRRASRGRPHAARGVSDRHRCRDVRDAWPPRRSRGPTCRGCGQPATAEACDRRRPAGLFEGPGQPHQRLRPDVDRAAGAARAGLAAADRGALARQRSRPMAICRANWRRWSARSTAATARSTGRRSAISTRALARPCWRALSHRACRPGDAAA